MVVIPVGSLRQVPTGSRIENSDVWILGFPYTALSLVRPWIHAHASVYEDSAIFHLFQFQYVSGCRQSLNDGIMHAIDFVIGGGREGTDETSFSWIERVVSEVALLGLSIVFSFVAMTAPTSALTIAPTIISARRPYARTYKHQVPSRRCGVPWCQLLRQRQSCPLYSQFRSAIRCRTIACDNAICGLPASSAVASSFGEHSFSSISSCRHSSVSKWRLALSSTNCSRRDVVQEVPLARGVAR